MFRPPRRVFYLHPRRLSSVASPRCPDASTDHNDADRASPKTPCPPPHGRDTGNSDSDDDSGSDWLASPVRIPPRRFAAATEVEIDGLRRRDHPLPAGPGMRIPRALVVAQRRAARCPPYQLMRTPSAARIAASERCHPGEEVPVERAVLRSAPRRVIHRAAGRRARLASPGGWTASRRA